MINGRRTLSLDAARAALRVRQQHGREIGQAVDAIDLTEAAGVQVRFVDVGSLEGMYLADATPKILIPSGRSSGRQAFSCAHELGHHMFGHGSRLDALLLEGVDAQVHDDEWMANMFAAFLLMPKSAVAGGFRRRGWDPRCPNPTQVLQVAQWLGVGYTTLLSQMAFTLGWLTRDDYSRLCKESPRRIISTTLRLELTTDAIVADEAWTDRAIDLRTGMVLALPFGSEVEGDILSIRASDSNFRLFDALRPGQARVRFPGGVDAFVRVARSDYRGRARFRFLTDPQSTRC